MMRGGHSKGGVFSFIIKGGFVMYELNVRRCRRFWAGAEIHLCSDVGVLLLVKHQGGHEEGEKQQETVHMPSSDFSFIVYRRCVSAPAKMRRKENVVTLQIYSDLLSNRFCVLR